MEKKTLIYLAIFTLFGFSLLGYLIIQNFMGASFAEVIFLGAPVWQQLAIGLAFGYVSAMAGWKIIETETLMPVRIFFSRLIKNFNLSFGEILFISFCAGVGEEVLFRGAIQPILNVWPTAIIFVAIHGYLNPFNWRLMLYGIFMTIVIAALGYMRIHFGLISAIAAHTMIDVVLLFKLAHDKAPLENYGEK